MKTTSLSAFALGAAFIGTLAACGGGSDESGSPTAFSVVPSEVTLSVPSGNPDALPVGTCYATSGGTGGRVYVYGGVPPYRIDNTSPGWVSVDRTTVAHKGEFFNVDFVGGCTTGSIVVVVDSLDHQVQVNLINTPASATTTP